MREFGTGGTYNVVEISASSSMEELVANINAEAGWGVSASTNADGKLVLSNNTGDVIEVRDESAAYGLYDGGSGFLNHISPDTFSGFIKLTSLDGSPITIEKGHRNASKYPGRDTGCELAGLGFQETIAV